MNLSIKLDILSYRLETFILTSLSLLAEARYRSPANLRDVTSASWASILQISSKFLASCTRMLPLRSPLAMKFSSGLTLTILIPVFCGSSSGSGSTDIVFCR